MFDRIAAAVRAGRLGRDGREIAAFRVTIGGIADRARLVRGAVVVRRVVFAVPGSLATPTGGYAYDRRIIAELASLGWRTDVLDIGSGFPQPLPATRAAARARLAAIQHGQPIVIDGLALGVLPEVAAGLSATHPLIALVHHPLALETGLSAAEAKALARKRAPWRLPAARHVVVATSASTARLLVADYDVPADRITVAPPGTDRAATRAGKRRRHGRAARRRFAGAAQGLRRPPGGARDARRPALAAHHRGRRARCCDRRSGRCGYFGA